MTPAYLLTAIAILVVGNYVNKRWRAWRYRNDPVFPDAPKRAGLYFGYLGCDLEQATETKGHVNVLNEVQFAADTPDKIVENIRIAGVDVMLGLSPQLFSRPDMHSKFTVRADAEARLVDFFTFLRLQGVLKYVRLLTPIDEPNNTLASVDEFAKAMDIVHKVAAQFPELGGYLTYAIYAADKPFMGRELVDWIGFDDYDMKGNVVNGKQYRELKASLLPHQQTIIIPGGSYGQDPMPFVNYAKASPEVGAVLAFLWADDRWGTVGARGVRSNGMAGAYVAAGMSVI